MAWLPSGTLPWEVRPKVEGWFQHFCALHRAFADGLTAVPEQHPRALGFALPGDSPFRKKWKERVNRTGWGLQKD